MAQATYVASAARAPESRLGRTLAGFATSALTEAK